MIQRIQVASGKIQRFTWICIILADGFRYGALPSLPACRTKRPRRDNLRRSVSLLTTHMQKAIDTQFHRNGRTVMNRDFG